MKLIVTFCLLIGLYGCSSAYIRPEKQLTETKILNIVHNGKITPNSVETILSELATESETVMLNITSGGGDEVSAIMLGNELKKRNLIIVIDEYCLSACTDLLLSAPENVILNKNAIIGFHVGILSWLEKLRDQNFEIYESRLHAGKLYLDFLNHDKDLAFKMFCIDQLHGLENEISYAETGPKMNGKYSVLLANEIHLRDLGIDPQYYEGKKLAPKIREDIISGGRDEWGFQMCKDIEKSGWNKVWTDLNEN